jgi:eukaryotic-like serine/threonine-protein kinase
LVTPAQLLEDRYVVEHRIGAGGMGEVFRGRDRVTGEVVAIKVLSDTRAHRTARFAREIRLLAELSHPGIVRHIAHGETPAGELFLVMEWLDGEDLEDRLARAPLTPFESIALAVRVAEALGVAHARGIVHRDLKPRNLFLPGGRVDAVQVLDFGIARREGGTQLTRTGMKLGTPGYMAPEQATRGAATVDARADVFALGCVLFRCLTGTPAFGGDSTAAVLAKILFGEAPRVRARWPDAPEDLDALVAQMLSRDPALRPGDGANLAAALASLEPIDPGAAAPAQRIVEPSAITGGERRFLAAVLVAAAPEEAAPEEDQAAAAEDDALRRAIRPHGGRVEPLADGSTIVVLEADRQVATDQAAQAARCALAMQPHAKGRPMAIAMGRGEAAARLPAGEVIDRASRLLAQLAETPGELPPIVLDEVSAGLLDARFDVVEREAGLFLRGERALAAGARTLLGRPTSCVGRDWELGALTGILDECLDERQARAVIVTAAAGMGKSRLAAELVSRVHHRGEPVAIWVGRGDSLRAGATLDLLAQALRGALGITGAEPLAERHAQLRRRIEEHPHVPAAERRRIAEFLGELVGAPFPGGSDRAALEAARQDARLMSEQMLRAWLDFLRAETAVQPVLLVLEDLQWSDFGTVRFLDTALRDCSGEPWMVLALARPEVLDVFPKLWADRQHVQEIRLKELGRKAGERLVRQVLGDDVGTETIERLVKQAGGNAFYLEELIRAAAEGKGDALPETVLAMVETRLGWLPAEARLVLRAASVFGEVCWEGGVLELLGGALGAAAVGEWLGRLAAQELLAVGPASRLAGERQLVFRHALLREGAYATLTDDDRRLQHRLAGAWLEARGEADPMVLAGHFERGDDRGRAAHHYLHAAEQAIHVLDLQAVVARAGLGLACDPPDELRIALLGIRCEAALYAPQLVGLVIADAGELLRTAPPGSRPWAQAMFPSLVGIMATGRLGEVPGVVGALRAAVPTPDAMPAMGLAYLGAITMLDAIGQLAEATALAERCAEVLRGAEDPVQRRLWPSLALAMRAAHAHDDPWRGLQHAEVLRELHEIERGERLFLSMHLFGGMNLWFLGANARAEQTLRGIPAADESMAATRRFCLAWLLADRGDFAEARDLATRLAETSQARRSRGEEGRARWVLAEVLRRSGEPEAAERELDAARELAGGIDQPGVLATLAALRLAAGRAEEARDLAADAVARATAIGGCGMFRGAFVRLVHAEALHATGALDAARAAIADARARLHAIAGRTEDPAYRQSFLDAVPENARTLALARAWLGE